MINLADVAVGARAKILGFNTQDRAYRQKLMAMGLTVGTQLTVIRRAPLGCPIEIEVRGFALGLRKNEAQVLQISLLNAES